MLRRVSDQGQSTDLVLFLMEMVLDVGHNFEYSSCMRPKNNIVLYC